MTGYILSAFADEASPRLDEQLAALAEAGIRQTEIRGVDGKSVADLTDAEAKEARRKLDDAGVSLSALGSPYGKVQITGDLDAHMNRFRRGLELCDILGAKRMRMFSFYHEEIKDPARIRSQVLDQLAQMANYAREAGVLLCHENEAGIYGDSPERCLDILTAFEGQIAGIFDPANFLCCGYSAKDAYPLLKTRVLYFHMKDALLDTRAIVPSGKGDGDIPNMLADFKGCDTCLTIEPHLHVFNGLNNLQPDALRHVYSYPDNRAAFRAAAAALKEVLTGIGYHEEETGKWTL